MEGKGKKSFLSHEHTIQLVRERLSYPYTRDQYERRPSGHSDLRDIYHIFTPLEKSLTEILYLLESLGDPESTCLFLIQVPVFLISRVRKGVKCHPRNEWLKQIIVSFIK